jgi:putative endonuclease
MTKTIKRAFGDIGENIACQFLMKRNYKIIKQNYLKPWGEIDIITLKEGTYHFIEVKSVSWETSSKDVIHETSNNSERFRPEENVHPHKLKRLHRTIESYLMENKIDTEWQLDIITVKINKTAKTAQVELIENIVEG